MTGHLLVRLDARDRALMLRCAITPTASRRSRLAWTAVTHLGGTGPTVAAAIAPWFQCCDLHTASRLALTTLLASHLAVQLVKRTVVRARPGESGLRAPVVVAARPVLVSLRPRRRLDVGRAGLRRDLPRAGACRCSCSPCWSASPGSVSACTFLETFSPGRCWRYSPPEGAGPGLRSSRCRWPRVEVPACFTASLQSQGPFVTRHRLLIRVRRLAGSFALERDRMRSLARRFLGGTTLALVTGVSVAQAQTTYPNVKVTGRLQEQFYYFGNEDYAATVGPAEQLLHPPGPDRGPRQHLGERGRLHPAVVRGRPEPRRA